MAALQTLDPIVNNEVSVPSAVVWIDDHQAMVAAMSHNRAVSFFEMRRGWLSETGYLLRVIGVVGDRRRVVILGPDTVRMLLEREYVAVVPRPDRLVDVEPSGPVIADELVARVRGLAA